MSLNNCAIVGDAVHLDMREIMQWKTMSLSGKCLVSDLILDRWQTFRFAFNVLETLSAGEERRQATEDPNPVECNCDHINGNLF